MAISSDKIHGRYDIVVVGAGPAGCNAARRVLDGAPAAGVSVLLIDKKAPWDHPVACAEAVGRLGFTSAVSVDPSWIRHNIRKAAFHSPAGISITYTEDTDKGYIIDRSKMQRDLAAYCADRGADCVFDTKVLSVSLPQEGLRTVRLENNRTIRTRVVIDASGPSSPLGKNEKIFWKAYDLEPAFFAHIDNVTGFAADTVHIYVGENVAPGGYAWVFPGEGETFNVGVVVGGSFSKKINIRSLLDTFIKAQFPGAHVVRYFAGAIPCGYRRGPIAVPGLIKAGDAACTVNPISRAGIAESLLSGKYAGEAALSMLPATTKKEIGTICKEYEKAWYCKRGKYHEKLARVKNSLLKIPDTDYNAAAAALSNIDRSKLTMAKIFTVSLGRFPTLVWALRHLM